MSSLSRSSSDTGNKNSNGNGNNGTQSNSNSNINSMAAITTTTAKKKLGKNLNKLTKPPAPPVNAESSKASAASRNGLLLLSTNKRNNSLLGYSNKSTSNTPLPSLGLQYESTASTHDVLLGAVVGAASSRADQQPDAWGVHNKDKDNQQPPMPLVEEHTPAKKETLEPAPPRSVTPPPRAAAEEAPAVPTVNWDEYGGRETTSTTRGLVSVDAPPVVITANMNKNEQEDDQQHAHMAKLARERAERRRQEEAARINEQKEKASQRLQALESKMGKGNSVLEASGGGGGSSHSNNNNNNNALAVTTRQQPTQQRTLYDPNQGRMCNSLVGGTRDRKNSGGASIASSHDEPRSPKGNATPGAYGGPVIHLNSYEDRDRGEATRPAAPRMLFDPKSGSMVAVPSRDEKPKKENAKTRGGRRGKNTKEDNDNNNGKGKKNQKSKKDSKSKGQAATKKHANPDRKFPRTRGVLYARDDKGNCYCADGCDGDLGYGAHSVPGGRVKNPKAFAKFSEQQQQLYKEQQQLQQQLLMKGREHGIGGYTNPTPSTGEYGLENGLAMPQDEHAAVLDWVKPNEKIELVTGMDDESPTLQATAREWAPSQAALAAAQNVAGLLSIGSHDMDEEEDDEDIINFEPRDNTAAAAVRALLNSNMDDDEDDDGPSFIGLGFDPTENMDSVIQSPSSRPDANAVSQLEGIDFGALGLAPALGGDNISNGNNNHIFAFGSSGTWGSAGDNHDWGAGLLGGHNAKPASASRLFGGLLESTPESDASPSPLDGNHDAFLSLATSGNTWGARTDNSVTPNIIPSLVGGDRSVSSERGVGGD